MKNKLLAFVMFVGAVFIAVLGLGGLMGGLQTLIDAYGTHQAAASIAADVLVLGSIYLFKFAGMLGGRSGCLALGHGREMQEKKYMVRDDMGYRIERRVTCLRCGFEVSPLIWMGRQVEAAE